MRDREKKKKKKRENILRPDASAAPTTLVMHQQPATTLRDAGANRRRMESSCLRVTGPLDVNVHQCTACKYTSVHKHNVLRHVESKCHGATVVSGTVTMVPADMSKSICIGTAHANNHSNLTVQSIDTQNITINVPGIVYVGSDEERAALFDVFKDPANLRELATLEPEEIPAALFRMWKGADASDSLKNIRVLGDKVEERRGPTNVVSVPRTKFVRRTVGDMLDTVVNAPCTTLDDISRTLQTPTLKVGKKRAVSRQQAAAMHAAGSKDTYSLDSTGRQFLDDSKRLMDRELDYYAAAADAADAVE